MSEAQNVSIRILNSGGHFEFSTPYRAITISTRRLSARPLPVALSATGRLAPKPRGFKRSGAILAELTSKWIPLQVGRARSP